MKNFRLAAEDIRELVDDMGYGMATDKITVAGEPVGFMYREEPDEAADSGWRFLSGSEDQEYVDDPENWEIFEVNTIANYDPTIVDYLASPEGTQLVRDEDGVGFVEAEEDDEEEEDEDED